MGLPPVTAAKRSKLYLVLACVFLLINVMTIVATVLPLWTLTTATLAPGVTRSRQTGLWRDCFLTPGGGWVEKTCTEHRRRTGLCDQWYQLARISSLIGISLTVIVSILAVACAMQTVITTILPLACLVVVVLASISIILVPFAWFNYTGSHCLDLEDQTLSASFILYTFCACLCLFLQLLASYLFKADILVPAEGPVIREEYKPYPSVYEIAPTYAAAPLAYPTATYAPSPTPYLY